MVWKYLSFLFSLALAILWLGLLHSYGKTLLALFAYRISANSCHGNYFFLDLALCNVKVHKSVETIRENTVLRNRVCTKMNSLYQICSKMLHSTKVIIFISWNLKKYVFILKDPWLALSASNMEVVSWNPSQATSFLFFPPKWLLSYYATFLS